MAKSALVVIAFAAALGVAPAMAQSGNPNTNTPQQTPAAQPKAARGTATISPTGIPPSQRNPLLTDNGDVRIGKVIGTDIYNKNDKKLGTVDGVLVDTNKQLNVVVSANNKNVLVPWDKLVFGDAKLSSDNKVLMPDETQASLNRLPAFHYQNQTK